MSLLIILVGIIIIVAVVVLIILGLKAKDGDDPLMGRLAEFSAREEAITLEEIELSQPFTERVVIPLFRKLGIDTKKLEVEKPLKTGSSLLKRIEQKPNTGDSSPRLPSLQSRRISASSATSQSSSYLDLKAHVQNKLLAEIDPSIDLSKTDEIRHIMQLLFEQILVEDNIIISRQERTYLFEQIASEILGFNISVSYPKVLSKKFETTFLIQIFLATRSANAKSNVAIEFQNQEVKQHITKSEISKGDNVKVKLFHPDFLFSDPVAKSMEHALNKIVVLGKPKDNCEPGLHKILVSILDAATEQELESFTFAVNVVDFAFGKISRPFLSKVSAVALGIGSFIMFILSLLEQIDKTVGFTSGTAAGVLMIAIYASFYNSYQRIRPIAP